MLVLGIETTCDETAAAVVERPDHGPGRILSNVVLSQIEEHAAFGGVVPEIAARAHVEALDLTARLTDGTPFPYCLFLASGGHTQIVAVLGVGNYVRLGTTVDDAIGEAFDKTAKLLGLGYPGGPLVEKEAVGGNPARF